MDVGVAGTVSAGTVLEWVDKAAYAAAVGWSSSYCVTAYVGNIRFEDPISSGDLVEVTASVVYTGSTSMHIRTEVSFSDPRELRPTIEVLFTTGYAETTVLASTAGLSSSEVINKPYRNEDLATRIRYVLDREARVA